MFQVDQGQVDLGGGGQFKMTLDFLWCLRDQSGL